MMSLGATPSALRVASVEGVCAAAGDQYRAVETASAAATTSASMRYAGVPPMNFPVQLLRYVMSTTQPLRPKRVPNGGCLNNLEYAQRNVDAHLAMLIVARGFLCVPVASR